MSFLDIVLGALLVYAFYKGVKNGLFVELASLVSLVVGIFVAIKFSYLMKNVLENNVTWNPKYIEITSFALTFLAVIFTIHLLAKFFTGVADFAYLGWLNKLGGATFSVLKTVLMLSIVFNIFQKINVNNFIVKQETLNSSMFYNPIHAAARFVYPTLEDWYAEFKVKTQSDKKSEK
ncbi:CvpA family protein [Flavobacterium sp.]|uniref:CvpA family protein n=1 Tax=Flavobacterium sp. TaxID=239 RepID=UPI00286DB15B|nr:CvpA family protein [Flavobacterium sp.]